MYVFVGLIIVGFVSAHMFATFEGLRDQQQYNALPGLIDALIADRKTMLLTDTLRSLILTGVAAGTLWLLLKNTLKQTAVIIVFAVLLLFDLISIDKRYVNEADFNPARNIENPL